MLKRKVLIIGIDGGSWDVLRPAMEEGYMPYLKSLVKQGASGILGSTIPAITPAAWGSFQTGMNPGKTGVLHFSLFDRDNTRNKLVSSQMLTKTIWEAASFYEKKVCVINVPMTYPPKKVNGFIVSGLLTPSKESNFTYPPNFKDELNETIPEYQILNLDRCETINLSKSSVTKIIKQMVRALSARVALAKYLFFKKGSFDLAMVHFQASDVIQHRLWGIMDEKSPLYNPNLREIIFNQFYKNLDASIQEISQDFNTMNKYDSCAVFIVSDHGFQGHRKQFMLNNFLAQEGLFTPAYVESRYQVLRNIFYSLRHSRFIKMIKRHAPSHFIDTLRSALGSSLIPSFNRDKTKAFAFGTIFQEGFIYITDSDNREGIIKEIKDKLEKVIEPYSGKPIIKSIFRKEEVYAGYKMTLMPDLVVIATEGVSIKGAHTADGQLFKDINQHKHLGIHHRDGIFAVSGENIQKDLNVAADIVDIAPTILFYLGLPVDREMDGKILTNIFTDGFLQQNQPKFYNEEMYSELEDKPSKNSFNQDDEQMIGQRLKDLGYI